MKIIAGIVYALVLLCAVSGSLIETYLVRKLISIFITWNEFSLVYWTTILYIGVILPIFAFIGIYASRQLSKSLRGKHESRVGNSSESVSCST